MSPWELVRDVTLETLLLPFAVALVVGLLVALILPRFGLAAVLAVIAAFLAGNEVREAAVFRVDTENPLTIADFEQTLGNSLSTGKGVVKISARYWLPWVGLLAAVVGLATRIPRLTWQGAFFIAWGTSYFIAVLLPHPHHFRWNGLFAVFLVMSWKTLEHLPKYVMPLAASAALLTTAMVLLHAHTARYADIAFMLSAAFLALTAIAWRTTPLSAAAIAAVMLPALLVVGYDNTFSDVPAASFILPATAPLMLAPLAFFTKPPKWLLILCLFAFMLSLGVAIGLAADAESLAF